MSDYRMYLFMKTTLNSMTRGRIAAQACHAGSLFHEVMSNPVDYTDHIGNAILDSEFDSWKSENGQFGTTIVLDGYGLEIVQADILSIKDCFTKPFNYFSVIDQEYHIKDGEEVLIVPNVRTGIILFCSQDDYDRLLRNYPLLS